MHAEPSYWRARQVERLPSRPRQNRPLWLGHSAGCSPDGPLGGAGSFVEEDETWDDQELVLYGVVGLQRGQGGAHGGSTVLVRDGRRTRAVRTSEGLSFAGPDGGSITVTSRRRGDDDHFDEIRKGAATGPFLASPHGRAAWAAGKMAGRLPRPVEVEWAPVTILVDGQGAPFDMCDLGDGYWAAAGRVAAATITIDSRQVPISAVSLERLASREPPPPPVPHLGDRTETVLQSLDDRFARVPFSRVHGLANYWALQAVEIDHVSRLTFQEGLSDQQREALKAYWLRRIEDRLREPMDRVRRHDIEAMHRSRVSRRLRNRRFLFQLWFNTLGPGAKTWFGNRYVGIRHYTFRLRWRP
jgi:hypothetical protein